MGGKKAKTSETEKSPSAKTAPAKEAAAATKPAKDPAPPKPNETEFTKRLDEIKGKIDSKKDQMKTLSEKIDKANTGKEEYEEKRTVLFNALEVVKTERAELIGKVRELQEQQRSQKKLARENDRDLKTMESSMKQVTEEGIDKEIQTLEYKMSTTTMSLKEEKDCMKKIKALKSQRPTVQKNMREYEQMKAKIEMSGDMFPVSSPDVISKLDACIQEKKTQQDDLYAQVQTLKSEREKSTSGVRELIDKKKGFKGEVDELIQQRTEILDEKRAMQKTFNEWEKKQRLEKQQKMNEQWAQEQAKWEAEKAKYELEKPNPYISETTLLEQTIAYCKGLLPKEAVETETCGKSVDHNNPEGAKILVSKKDREKEMFFEATKKKSMRKKGSEKRSTAIKHTADTFAIFDQIKLAAPMSTGDLEVTLEKLQAEMDKVNEKVRAWEKERKEKLEVAESAAATTTKTEEAA